MSTDKLDCLLLFPPACFELKNPEIGLPQLSAYLNSRGLKTRCRDLNNIFINRFIPDNRAAVLGRIRARLSSYAKDDPLLDGVDLEAIRGLELSSVYGEHSSFLSDKSMVLLNQLVGITEDEFDIRKIIHAIDGTNDRLFSLFFERHIKPIAAGIPVIGFSILSHFQLVSALYFSRLIKKYFPSAVIVWGGPWCICTKDSLSCFKPIFKYVDYVVTGEGEIPLEKIVAASKRGVLSERYGGIPQVAFVRNGRIVHNPATQVVDLDHLPPLDFTGYIDDTATIDYLPFLTTKGCYWGKCIFCNHTFKDQQHRVKSPDRLIAELQELIKRHGISTVSFADSSVAPSLLIELARRIIRSRMKLSWDCLIRADKPFSVEELKLLKSAGCSGLYVGLECVDQGALKRINKGITLEHVDSILQNASVADVEIRLFIINFPLQTIREYQATWEYIISKRELIRGVIPQDFYLGRNTSIFCSPEYFKIKKTKATETDIRSFSLPYINKGELDQKEFNRLTLVYSRKFHERKDNYQIVRRIYRNRHRKYLLIRPPSVQAFSLQKAHLNNDPFSEPLSLLKIGALLKELGHRVVLLDCLENAYTFNKNQTHFYKQIACGNYAHEKIKKDVYKRGMSSEEFDLRLTQVDCPDEIFITSQFTYEYDFIRETVEKCKERFPRARIVVGGICASLCADQVRSLGVEVYVGMFSEADKKWADFSLLRNIPEAATIKFSRGCLNMCAYCAVSVLEGRRTYFKSVQSVLEEIKHKYTQYQIRRFFFWESNPFGHDAGYFKALLNGIIKMRLDIKIEFPEGLQPSLISPEFARALRQARTKLLVFAFESIDPGFQQQFNRPSGAGKVDLINAVRNWRNTRMLPANGISLDMHSRKMQNQLLFDEDNDIKVFVLLGFPKQTRQEIIRSIVEVWKCAALVFFTPFTPIPSTRVYEQYKDSIKGRDLISLHPLVWPMANTNLPVSFLEDIYSCHLTESFFEVANHKLIPAFRDEFQRYRQIVRMEDLDEQIKALRNGNSAAVYFRLIDLKVKKSQITLQNIRKIVLFIQLLIKNKVHFYFYRPIPKCIINFGKYWYSRHIPEGCSHCFEADCAMRNRRLKPLQETAFCRDCNNLCKNCFYDE